MKVVGSLACFIYSQVRLFACALNIHCYIELRAPICNFPFRKQWYIAIGSGSCMRSEERDITVPPSLPNTGDFAQFKAHGRGCRCNLYKKGFEKLG